MWWPDWSGAWGFSFPIREVAWTVWMVLPSERCSVSLPIMLLISSFSRIMARSSREAAMDTFSSAERTRATRMVVCSREVNLED